MRSHARLPLVLCALIAIAAGLACGSGAPDALLPGGSGGVYVALGDSFAAGDGASDPATASYVARIGAALRDRYGEALEVRNLAVGGATTQSLIDSQLPDAIAALTAGDVRLVTITIGGNDLNELQSSPDTVACLEDVASPACPVADLLVGTEERLDAILGELRSAAPDAVIAMELYPNVFAATGHVFEGPAGAAFGMLNDVIAGVAGRHDILLADPRAPFARGGISHVLDPTPDPHPNDDGHRAIAEAFLEALGLAD